MLGKEVRLGRLIPNADDHYFGLTVDHAIARGVMPGLDTIDATIAKMVAGGPNAITMHKGIAEKCFAPYAGKVPLVLKLTTFGVYHFEEDVQVADVGEAVCLGADAVSTGCIVGGDNQDQQLAQLGRLSRDAAKVGMPIICHIYPRGNHITGAEQYSVENVTYAARAAAELGIDLVKTNYTGDPESFAKVVQAVPTRVAIAGGTKWQNGARLSADDPGRHRRRRSGRHLRPFRVPVPRRHRTGQNPRTGHPQGAFGQRSRRAAGAARE